MPSPPVPFACSAAVWPVLSERPCWSPAVPCRRRVAYPQLCFRAGCRASRCRCGCCPGRLPSGVLGLTDELASLGRTSPILTQLTLPRRA